MARAKLLLLSASVAIGGALLAWVAVSGASSEPLDPEAVARAYLAQNDQQQQLQAGLDDLDLREIRESPGAYHIRFQQTIGGVPVFGGHVTVNISKGSGEVSFALSRYARPTTAGQAGAAIGEADAIEIAQRSVGAGKPRGTPQVEQIYYREDKVHHLAWQVSLPTLAPVGDWLVIVRASDGAVLLQDNLITHDSGQVFDSNPVVTSGGTVPPPTDCDSGTNATTLSPQYRNRTLLGIQGGQDKLKGAYVDLTAPGIVGSIIPAGQADEPSRVYKYPCNDARFEETMVYYHVDSTQRKMQSLGFTGNSSILARPIPAHAHYDDGSIALRCNAFYSAVDRGLHFGDGDPACGVTDFAEDGDVIVHEYGHAIQDFQVPGFGIGPPAAIEQALSMGEGFGDFLASAMFGDPCEGEWLNLGMNNCGGLPGLRWLQNSNVYPADFEACLDLPNGKEEEHCGGLVWGGALWDLVEALGGDQAARDLALTLVLDSHFYLDPQSTFAEAASAIRQADVDMFGGAHVSTINAAFAGRGIVSTGPISEYPYAFLSIIHDFVEDLEVHLKVGDVSAPDCDLLLWDHDPGFGALYGFVDLTGSPCEPLLPPSSARPWWLEAADNFFLDDGVIQGFSIALSGTTLCKATDLPVIIPSTDTPVYSMVDCTTTVKPPSGGPTPTPTGPTATPTNTPTATPEKAAGDVNDDGQVNAIDAALVLQLGAGLVSSLPNEPSGDVDLNGSLNAVDAALILQFIAGLIPGLPV